MKWLFVAAHSSEQLICEQMSHDIIAHLVYLSYTHTLIHVGNIWRDRDLVAASTGARWLSIVSKEILKC